MRPTRRIFVSLPDDRWLTPTQNDLKWGIVERIESAGYLPEIFLDPTGRKSLAAGDPWSADRADKIIRRCYGAALIGLPRWTFNASDGPVRLPTEFSHYEGAVARTLALPLLILAQQNLLRRTVFEDTFGPFVGVFPEGVGRSWLDTPDFERAFGYWHTKLEQRRDVFLGYSGAATSTATEIRDYLEQDLGATVLDWQRDFRFARSILPEIEEARTRCGAGIFLFTKDDDLANPGPGREAAPRDNVVFEAGYFAASKGKDRVLIIRETGAKMPADLGGDIYASLDNRTNLDRLKQSVASFLADL